MTPAEARAVFRELAKVSLIERRTILRLVPPESRRALLHCWIARAREEQIPPLPGEKLSTWHTWLFVAGRASGKTRAAAEYLQLSVMEGWSKRIALVGATAADARDVLVEGKSGLLAVAAPGWRPSYEPSKRRLTWPNGAVATVFSADEPDRLRGPEHDFFWGDELASWNRAEEAWHNIQLGLRLGPRPCGVITTTPRPIKIIRDLIADPTTFVSRSSTYANRENLPAHFLEYIKEKYEGTRLGRQEIYAEVLTDTPGALWTLAQIEECRVVEHPDLARIVVAIDPAVSTNAKSDETGIVAIGLGIDKHAYVLADESGKYTPNQWARKAIELYEKLGADLIVGEVNNGGDLVGANVRTVAPHANFKAVVASRGKQKRMEPVAALYEQEKCHHVGVFAKLEDQMTTWSPTESSFSPDRADSLAWGITELMLGAGEPDFTEPKHTEIGSRRNTMQAPTEDGGGW